MNKTTFNNNLMSFISKSTCCYTCVKEIKKILDDNGYQELYEYKSKWKLTNRFYIIRNDASIIAFELPNKIDNSFNIVTTHLDTPSLLLKPNGAYIKENYLKYNIMPYGGLLNFGWLDHYLSLAGRVVIKDNNKLKIKIIDMEKPIAIIPSVAIHQNDQANTNLDLNMQIDLQPIISLNNDIKTWDKLLKRKIKEKIIDYDLFLYNPTKPILIDNSLLISPRIDNITSVYSSLYSFLNSNNNNIKVFCSFNNEEIGSLTEEGADSNFLLDCLKRVCALLNIDFASSLANSFIVSSDNTHAMHPNHTELADDTSVIHMNKGFTIIKESESTTNAVSASIIKSICDKYHIKYQYETSKNDISGGSTLSGISLRHVSVLSIDVGIAQLSMHSSIETCSINDVYELYKMMKYFYETKIIKKNNSYEIN